MMQRIVSFCGPFGSHNLFDLLARIIYVSFYQLFQTQTDHDKRFVDDSSYEPRQVNLCLRAFRHDKFQLRMPSHSEGPGIWLSV